LIRLGKSGRTLRPGDEVVTFVNRNLEPYRGYHVFMRALPAILAARPEAHAILIGGNGVSYGRAAPEGQTWKDIFLGEVKDRLDMSRVHFVGQVPHSTFVNALQVSAAHVYLTYPFVLSWSMLEAMSAGCLVVASDTPPVAEVIRDGENGLLFPFFDTDALSRRVIEALAEPRRFREVRARARADTVERYDLRTRCLPRQLALIEELMS
jgi:glycosyltransferase involved in cell wall biosynthesis